MPPPTSPVPPAEAARPVARKDRRRLVVELLIVLSVFPLPYVVSALQALVAYLLGEGPGRRIPILFPGHIGAGLPFVLLEVALPLAAAALALYLLSLPGGDGGPSAIGLDRKQPRGDLALLLPVFVLCDLIPIAGGSLVLTALGVHGPSPATGGLPTYYDLAYLAMAVVAGIVEEIVVLGYLVRRLEQIGLKPFWVVAIAVAVRASYHLYYGWGVLPIVAWATVSVLVYRRFRRLGPFILVHALWDSGLFLLGHYLLAEVVLLTPATIVFTAMWWRYLPPKGPPPGGRGTGAEAWSTN
ncbi:MAG TPA: CPBP family intramembrane glutamic endopeptidase [Acidimicrobiales bacterium]|nr:CPBP family intramembrane glutamic endopeptidase [Acidimicrobiales bacterium]